MCSPRAQKGPVVLQQHREEAKISSAQLSMSVPRLLHTVALLLLQGEFPLAASDTVTLQEGENLNLQCTLSTLSDSSSALQWLNPRGFTIFLNAQRVLRDQRYKLLHYSQEELSIQLPNVTVQDEGVYSCFHYGKHFKNKSQKVEILAAPSHPVLEVSQDAGRGITLSCHTQGCKPQPQVSWLLDNGIELPGDTRHQLGADGKKWSTTSTLRVLSYSPKVTASCIIQHPALRGHKLMAAFPFQDLPSTGSRQPTRLSEDIEVTSPSENPAVPSPSENPAVPSPSENPAVPSPSENPAVPSPSENPAVPSPSENPVVPSPSENPAVPSPSASPEDPAVLSPSANPAVPSPSAPQKDAAVPSPSENPAVLSPSASQNNPAISSPSASQKTPAVPSSAAAPAQQNPTADVTSNGPEGTLTTEELGSSWTSDDFSGAQTAPGGNGTGEELPRTEATPAHENRTGISILTLEQNPESKGMVKKERNLLLPVLVAALVLVLLIIVLLFVLKLKKAHGVWKRENDVSEQTLESYKSKSNEDSPGHEKNGQAINPKSNLQYVTEGYVESKEKNLESTEKNSGDKNIVISEKMFNCGKETDV